MKKKLMKKKSGRWKTIIDFTKIEAGGIKAEDLLAQLEKVKKFDKIFRNKKVESI